MAPSPDETRPSDRADMPRLALRSGRECTINRVGDQYFDHSARNGNDERDDDVARLAALEIKAVRYPILWEKVAPDGLERPDWALSDRRLAALRQHGIAIAIIAGLVHQCQGVVLAMRHCLRNPRARLVQTDDPGKTFSTGELADAASFYKQRRWLSWDLLCGMVDQRHRLWSCLIDAGIGADDILWGGDNPCPPDIAGVNYQVTSERWLDHRRHHFPAVRPGAV